MAQKDVTDQYEYDVIYDTETTGLPDWKIPSDDPGQPHVVSIAAVKCERATGKIIQSLNLIIKPNGWVSCKEALETHGITEEYASKVGVPEGIAVLMLLHLCDNSMRVSYNQTFDQRMIRIQLKRMGLSDDVEQWARMDNHACAMRMSANIMKLPPYGKYGWRNPKLEVAYKHFTGKEHIGAHGAMADTMAAKEVFYSIVNANGGKIPIPGNGDQKTEVSRADQKEDITIDSGDDSEALFGDDKRFDPNDTGTGSPCQQPIDQDFDY